VPRLCRQPDAIVTIGRMASGWGAGGDTLSVMTAVADAAVLAEALAVIDQALTRMAQRELVAAVEVSDLLLDVRSLLAAQSKD
jgi:hypothetical protein